MRLAPLDRCFHYDASLSVVLRDGCSGFMQTGWVPMSHIAGILRILAGLAMVSCAEAADGERLGQASFPICARPVHGVNYAMHLGLDADVGRATSRHGSVSILIGGPSAFFDNPLISLASATGAENGGGRTIVVPKSLPTQLRLIGTVEATDREGAASLYGFSSEGAAAQWAQDPILVLLTSGNSQADARLQSSVGAALYRCD